MFELNLTVLFASVVAGAAPIVLAVVGETITEKAGLINLSLDGSILLSAMAAFTIAFETNSLMMGFVCGAIIGALVATTVAVFSIYLLQNQVAVGFVLTLMTRDLVKNVVRAGGSHVDAVVNNNPRLYLLFATKHCVVGR